MMPGYVIADVSVTDPETYAGYRALTPGTIEPFGGRFLVRGGDHEVIAGAWAPSRLVLLGFGSAASTTAWYDSPAYAKARAIRQRASTGSVVIVGGVEGVEAARSAGGFYLLARHGADWSLDAAGAAARGGRILISSCAPDIKEGAWSGKRVSVLEFADAAEAQVWCKAQDGRPAADRTAAAAGVDAVLAAGA